MIGSFSGLLQNSTLTIGSEQFRITYYTGGDGNDVVLTQITGGFIPPLKIERASPASVRLLWPTNPAGFTLQFNTNLSTTNWASGSPPPVTDGTNNVVTNAATGTQKFYRLSRP